MEFEFSFCQSMWKINRNLAQMHNILWCAKGQLISKCPFGVKLLPKYRRNYFWISALKIFEPSWGLPGSFFGLPVGFLVYDIEY